MICVLRLGSHPLSSLFFKLKLYSAFLKVNSIVWAKWFHFIIIYGYFPWSSNNFFHAFFSVPLEKISELFHTLSSTLYLNSPLIILMIPSLKTHYSIIRWFPILPFCLSRGCCWVYFSFEVVYLAFDETSWMEIRIGGGSGEWSSWLMLIYSNVE